uniref:Secreted protein n=1 Tax=Panagrellus redivivus TaxID=6233 RepID=A0A7E4VU17_PANRE
MRVLFLFICLYLAGISSTFVLRPQPRRHLRRHDRDREETKTGSIVSAIRFWLPWTSKSKPIPREPPQCTHFDLKVSNSKSS